MLAVPTDSLVLADAKADFFVVATDLISQAEHSCYSTVWLVTDGRALAEAALDIVPKLIDDLPELKRDNAFAGWRDYAAVILCENSEPVAAI